MRQAMAPVTFQDPEPEMAVRTSVVAAAPRSPAAATKAARRRTPDHLPVRSFPSLLDHLATLVESWVQPLGHDLEPFAVVTKPTPLQ